MRAFYSLLWLAHPALAAWHISGNQESCNDVCGRVSLPCTTDNVALNTQAKISFVANLVGRTCNQYQVENTVAPPYYVVSQSKCTYSTTRPTPSCTHSQYWPGQLKFCCCGGSASCPTEPTTTATSSTATSSTRTTLTTSTSTSSTTTVTTQTSSSTSTSRTTLTGTTTSSTSATGTSSTSSSRSSTSSSSSSTGTSSTSSSSSISSSSSSSTGTSSTSSSRSSTSSSSSSASSTGSSTSSSGSSTSSSSSSSTGTSSTSSSITETSSTSSSTSTSSVSTSVSSSATSTLTSRTATSTSTSSGTTSLSSSLSSTETSTLSTRVPAGVSYTSSSTVPGAALMPITIAAVEQSSTSTAAGMLTTVGMDSSVGAFVESTELAISTSFSTTMAVVEPLHQALQSFQWVVSITSELRGVDSAALDADPDLQAGILAAVERAILAASHFSRADLSTRMLEAPRGQRGGRGLQAGAGGSLRLATALVPPKPLVAEALQLASALQGSKAELADAMLRQVRGLQGAGKVAGPGAVIDMGIVAVDVTGRETANASSMQDPWTLCGEASSTSTTQTTTAAPGELAATDILEPVSEVAAGILRNMRMQGWTNGTELLPAGGRTYGIKLDAVIPNGFDKSWVDVPVPEHFGLKVSLPPTLKKHLPGIDSGDELVLFLSDLGGRKPEGAVASAVIEFHLLSGPAVPVDGLEQPILFELPTNYSEELACAFWDNSTDEWSTRGVSAHASNVIGKQLLCATYHLSLFGAILQGIVATLRCANFALFHGEALAELLGFAWCGSPGGLFFLGLLAALLACFLAGAALDRGRAGAVPWRDDFFLVEKEEQAVAAEGTSSLSPSEVLELAAKAARAAKEARAASLKAMVGSCLGCCVASPEVREAVDDIGSSWFSYFSEVRSLCDSIAQGHEGHAELLGASRLCKISHKVLAHLLVLASRRLTASSLCVSNSVVTYVLEDQALADYIVSQRLRERQAEAAEAAEGNHAPVRGHLQREDWRTSTSQRDAWEQLRREILDQLHQRIHHHHTKSCGLLSSILAAFMSQHPLGEIFVLDIFSTCKEKVLMLAADLLGTFAFSVAFFEASGLVRGKPRLGEVECEVAGSFGRRLGRFLVIALSCLFLATLPVVLLGSLQTKALTPVEGGRGSQAARRQLRVWRVQERLFWLLGLTYVAACTAYIALFLASIGSKDHVDWATMGLIALLQDFFLIPLAVAIFVSLLTKMLLTVHSRFTGIEQHHLVRTVSEMLHQNSNMMLPMEMV